jgi:hypothetical protein
LQLKEGTDWRKFEKKLPAFCDRYINSQEWYKRITTALNLPHTYVRHSSSFQFQPGSRVNGNARQFHFCFSLPFHNWNCMDQLHKPCYRGSIERAREVGMRKVLGLYGLTSLGSS